MHGWIGDGESVDRESAKKYMTHKWMEEEDQINRILETDQVNEARSVWHDSRDDKFWKKINTNLFIDTYGDGLHSSSEHSSREPIMPSPFYFLPLIKFIRVVVVDISLIFGYVSWFHNVFLDSWAFCPSRRDIGAIGELESIKNLGTND